MYNYPQYLWSMKAQSDNNNNNFTCQHYCQHYCQSRTQSFASVSAKSSDVVKQCMPGFCFNIKKYFFFRVTLLNDYWIHTKRSHSTVYQRNITVTKINKLTQSTGWLHIDLTSLRLSYLFLWAFMNNTCILVMILHLHHGHRKATL